MFLVIFFEINYCRKQKYLKKNVNNFLTRYLQSFGS